MNNRARMTLTLVLTASSVLHAADASPVSFMDSLQLMDGEREAESDPQGLKRELTPTEILKVEGDGYGPTVSKMQANPEPLAPEDIKPLSTDDQEPEASGEKEDSQDNVSGTVQFPNLMLKSSDISAASKKARTVKDKYMQGKESKPAGKPAEVVDKGQVNGMRRQLVVTPGVLEVLPISDGGHINRMSTPFDDPLVKTTSGAEISTVGSVVEVSTRDRGTIVVYVSDQDQTPETTFSVALVPKSVPPLDINLRFDPLLAKQFGREGKLSGKAKKWEEQQNYVDALTSLMKPLANQEIPPGYSFTQVAGGESHADLFRCKINGLRIDLQQRLDGHNFKVGVHKVTNMLSVPVEIRETACYRKGVAAVSAYPQVVLRPGETTELYIAQRASVSARTVDIPERPSVVGREVPHGSY